MRNNNIIEKKENVRLPTVYATVTSTEHKQQERHTLRTTLYAGRGTTRILDSFI